jgi:hypothetical protein
MAVEGDSGGEATKAATWVATYVAEDNICFTAVNGKVPVSSRGRLKRWVAPVVSRTRELTYYSSCD